MSILLDRDELIPVDVVLEGEFAPAAPVAAVAPIAAAPAEESGIIELVTEEVSPAEAEAEIAAAPAPVDDVAYLRGLLAQVRERRRDRAA